MKLSEAMRGHAGGKRKYTEKQSRKFSHVMREGYAGRLHSGKGGPVVTDPRQMKAIAASEAGVSYRK